MTKVFISYSRKDKVFAEKLNQALKEIDLDSWIDWIDIPPIADWWDQIQKGIESADAFIFLLSPDSVASKVCRQELEHAIKNGKRMIPLVVRDINSNDVHTTLNKLNWIYFREQDDFDLSLKKLETGIKTDFAWVEFHRRLQVRGVDWEKRKDRSLLLRGKDLREAEEQLAVAGQKDPQPTDLQRQYLLESRRSVSRARNSVLVIGALVIVALVFLSVYAFNQQNLASANALTAVSNQYDAQTAQVDALNQKGTAVVNEQEAIRQAKISKGQALAANSQLASSRNQLSLLLGIESFQSVADLTHPERLMAEQALRDSLGRVSGIPLIGHEGPVTTLAFSPDGHWLATGSFDHAVRLWNMQNPSEESITLNWHEDPIELLAFSPDNRLLATVGGEYAVLWDIQKLSKDPIAMMRLGGSPVRAIIFSQDGRWLVTASVDGKIGLWDPKNPYNPIVLHAHEGNVTFSSLDISPDSRWLATVSFDSTGTVRLWDMQDPSADPIALSAQDDVTLLAFSPDGHWLVGGGYSSAQLWDMQNFSTEPIVLDGIPSIIMYLDFSSDGHWLATGSWLEAKVRLWDMQNPSPDPIELTWPEGQVGFESVEGAITNLTFSPDSHWLVTGSGDNNARLWDLQNIDRRSTMWSTSITLAGHEGNINAVAFSPDSKILATGSGDGSARLWDMRNLFIDPIRLFGHEGQRQSFSSHAFSPDGRWLATAIGDNLARLWDMQNISNAPIVLRGHDKAIAGLAFSYNGYWLATGSYDNTVRLWDMQNPYKEPIVITGYYGQRNVMLDFSPDGKWFANINDNNIVSLWDIKNPSAGYIFSKEFEGWVDNIAFSPDSRWLAISINDDTARLWDMKDILGEPIILKGHENYIMAMSFSQDGHWLATAGRDQTVRLWDIQNVFAEPIVIQGYEGYLYPLAFSPDNHWLAMGSENNIIQLKNIQNLSASTIILRGHSNTIINLAFSPDSRWLVTTSLDKTTRLWDIQNPSSEPIFLYGQEGQIDNVAFSPDGHWLGTVGEDLVTRLWDMDYDGLVEKACKTVGRNFTRAEWAQYFPREEYRATCARWPLAPNTISTPTP